MGQPQQWSAYYFFTYSDLVTCQNSCNYGTAAYGLKFVSLSLQQVWTPSPGRWTTIYLLVMGA